MIPDFPDLPDLDDERSCPGCGATESQWAGFEGKGSAGKGSVPKDGEFYCCQECAEGKICSCDLERLDSLINKPAA